MNFSKYNVDEALADRRPWVELRGKRYRVADLPARKRIVQEFRYLELQGGCARLSHEVKTCSGEERLLKQAEFERTYDEYQLLGVSLVLEDVPDEVAIDLTEVEMQAIETLYNHWRESKVPAEAMLGERGSADGKPKEA